ncbi:MAG TPA: DUF3696 domain-containing protein, partial [Methylomirabilota bacterium]|nr:DUF3696 domain-containing protein [Methylomirabilota bacterium]
AEIRRKDPFKALLRSALRPFHSGKVDPENVSKAARILGLGSAGVQLKQLRMLAETKLLGDLFRSRVAELQVSSSDFKALRESITLVALPYLLAETDAILTNLFRAVRYTAPIRATAERYYRHQDLAVDEADPQGGNLAMFLRSLTWNETNEFNDWCRLHFGFSISAKGDGPHISLMLHMDGGSVTYNIADVGFGFSQMLPVIVQIWSLNRPPRRAVVQAESAGFVYTDPIERFQIGDIVAIEQPELHLHPRLQARIADMLVAAVSRAKSSKRSLTMLIETHSETIVNRVGSLILERKINPEEVQILVFERNHQETETQLRVARYSEQGFLENWPAGFFLSEEM